MQNFLEKLNTPAALISVLIVIILANGALFYQSRSSSGNPPESGLRQNSGNIPQDRATVPPEQTTAEATTPPEETTLEEAASEETSSEETTRQGAAAEEPADDGGNSGGEGESGNDRTPVEVEDSTLLAGLGSSVETCRGSAEDEECIRSFVSEVAPDSRYVGGRVDLAAGGGGQNTEVIYFEDPRLTACEFERAEYEADGGRYAVILVGEGSFNDERGAQCIPQA